MQNKKVFRAGVIPFIIEKDEIEMMFMMPNDPENKFGGEIFQLAKGKIEEGESDEQAAFREANEELGLFKGNVTNIYDLGTFLGRTHIYIAEVERKDMFGDPHFETKTTTWMTLTEFIKDGRNLHKPVVKAAARLIEAKRQPLTEMANYMSDVTGLMDNTKIRIVHEPKQLPHSVYRFKIYNPQRGSATIKFNGNIPAKMGGRWDFTGDEWNTITSFIRLNQTALMDITNGKISDAQLKQKLMLNRTKVI